jgi:hypothetical protein
MLQTHIVQYSLMQQQAEALLTGVALSLDVLPLQAMEPTKCLLHSMRMQKEQWYGPSNSMISGKISSIQLRLVLRLIALLAQV